MVQPDNDKLRAAALSLTGAALEKRTTSYRNWTPAAIDLYERLNTLESSSENGEKLAACGSNRLRIKNY